VTQFDVDQTAALPDEDALVVPAGRQRIVMARRGGAVRPDLAVGKAEAAKAAKALGPFRQAVRRRLASADPDAESAEAAGAFLDDPTSSSASPLGAAVVAVAMLSGDRSAQEPSLAPLADEWVEQRGVVFATRAMLEICGISYGEKPLTRLPPLPEPRHADGYWPHFHQLRTIAAQVRGHLAVASDADHAEACAAAAEYRALGHEQRVFTSFLFPARTEWVDEDWRNHAAYRNLAQEKGLLICALSTPEQFDAQPPQDDWYGAGFDLAATVADGAPQHAGAWLARWYDVTWHAENQQFLLSVVACVPTDEAFQALIDRLDRKPDAGPGWSVTNNKHVRTAVIEACRHFPVRAVRLLAASAAQDTAIGTISAALLRAHVLGNPRAVEAALPQLSERSREIVEAIGSAPIAPPADAERLPPVLVTPPWLAADQTARPAAVKGLRRPSGVGGMVWRTGEAEQWATMFDAVADNESYPRWEDQSWPERADVFIERQQDLALAYVFFADGPEEITRALIRQWRPASRWQDPECVRSLIPRYGLDALPAALHIAHTIQPIDAGILVPFAAYEVADQMAEWLARGSKSTRPAVLAWLGRHPAFAATALIPAAVGKAGPARRGAEAALRALVASGRGDEVMAAAEDYGRETVEAVEFLLEHELVLSLPNKVPGQPSWLEPWLLPQVLLRDRSAALPPAAVRHLCTMLAISKPGDVYAGVAIVKEACDPASLAEFAWQLFQFWRDVDYPPQEGWILEALRWLGDDETVRRLSPVIRVWPGEGGHQRAATGLAVLTDIGTDVALMHLNSIAQKVRFRALREKANERIAEVAADLGLSPEQLADRLVPDFDLDPAGTLVLDYGPRRFTVDFDERLQPYVTDESGRRLKALPKPGARDDAESAAAAYRQFGALKKDVRTVAADQLVRLERAMVTQRRWTAAEFAELFIAHPLLRHLARRLVWICLSGPGAAPAAFRVAEDGSYADLADEPLTLPAGAEVGIAHPLHLADDLAAWSDVFADYEVVQPFQQLGRAVFALTDAERAATSLDRFAGCKLPVTTLLGMEKHGWRRGAPQDGGGQNWMERVVPGGRAVVADLYPGIPIGNVHEFGDQELTTIWLNDKPYGQWSSSAGGPLTFGELDPVTASEVLRDLTEVTGSGA